MLILIKFYLNGDFMHDQVVKFDTVYTTLTISQIRWKGNFLQVQINHRNSTCVQCFNPTGLNAKNDILCTIILQYLNPTPHTHRIFYSYNYYVTQSRVYYNNYNRYVYI